jgi:uncharacterized OsmC-like protein
LSNETIRAAIERVAQHFTRNPQDAISHGKPAVAVVESGLRCRAEGPGGAVLVSDMPKAIGGGGSAPTPGWFLLAALANCDATVIAMRAAQVGIELTQLEVHVQSTSDDRGIVGVGADVAPGPLAVRVNVRIAADGASSEQLHDLVQWAERHSPIGDALRRAVTVTTEVAA